MLRKKISNNGEGLSLSRTNGQGTEISGLLCQRLIETGPIAHKQLVKEECFLGSGIRTVLFNGKVGGDVTAVQEEERLFTIKGNTEREQTDAEQPLIPLANLVLKQICVIRIMFYLNSNQN